MGVIYVEGLNDAYKGHRYCENNANEKMTGGDVWFWTKFSKQDSDKEDEAQSVDIGQEILNFVWPGEHKVVSESTKGQLPPWKWPGAEKYPDATSLMKAMRESDNTIQAHRWTPYDLLRSFHPKGTAYQEHAKHIFGAIADNRDAIEGNGKTNQPNNNPSVKDKNECHGVGGDYWVMSRDVVIDNAKAFCGQGEKVVKYNKDSVNELELSVSKTGDNSKGPKDDLHCLDRLQNAVIDGCDGADHKNNPHNYKFGSKFTSADGWVYQMKPQSKQVNEVSCDVSYKFFYDFFEIRGKNLPDAKLGANGDGLKKELQGCGRLTKWHFEQTPHDVKFQWYAKGQLPIGTKKCTGRALESAGGSSKGHCHGAGRRSTPSERRTTVRAEAKRDSIDEWPGYGEDSAHEFSSRAVTNNEQPRSHY
ncbi:hypothetical protein QQS21_004393 [Conoideocrella luteorostrata]|uniref:Uncharacterized protein n=1 Tax=Conoideocrella luteorostrata TaxID=1105319 RepID=A0AAJ0CRL7_9HYPO|nr:hypothetical protein QQS21_004393 [Conoideocrella luteorostrata]